MIGLFDSGVGGLFALRELRRLCPQADFLYFADTRHLPYGERPPHEILTLSRRATELLIAYGADAILAACGTVGSVSLPRLREEYPLPLFGIHDPLAKGAAALWQSRGGGIALLGTAATVCAGVLAEKMAALAPHAPLYSLACPDFVSMAEAPAFSPSSPAVRAGVRAALAPLRGREIGVAVLGCTHFSRLSPLIAEALPGARIADGAILGAAATAAALPPALTAGRGTCRLYTSGSPSAFAAAAAAILGERVPVFPALRAGARG